MTVVGTLAADTPSNVSTTRAFPSVQSNCEPKEGLVGGTSEERGKDEEWQLFHAKGSVRV